MNVFDMRNGDFYILPPAGDANPMYADMVGIDFCHDNYRIIRNPAQVTVIGYVLTGQGHIQLGSGSFLAKAGDSFILPANQLHDYSPALKDTWSFLWFNVRGPLILQLLDAYRLSAGGLYEGCSIERLLRKGIALVGSKDGSAVSMHHKISGIILEIMLELSEALKSTNIPISPEVLSIKHYLDQNIEESVTMDQLSEAHSITPRHINRLFKKELGTTPYNYLLDKKIELAKNLLANTNIPVSSIAGKLKFADAYYFSNMFKRKTGLSPRQYRKNPV
jgi:AraC-like DNA-binding protein